MGLKNSYTAILMISLHVIYSVKFVKICFVTQEAFFNTVVVTYSNSLVMIVDYICGWNKKRKINSHLIVQMYHEVSCNNVLQITHLTYQQMFTVSLSSIEYTHRVLDDLKSQTSRRLST